LQEVFLAIKVVTKANAQASTFPLSDAKLSIVNGQETSEEKTDKTALFIMNVSQDDVLQIKASNSGFYANSEEINVKNEIPTAYDKSSYTINKTIILEPIVVGEEIVLENIYYDFEKWDIRTDAEPSLIVLANKLKDNPEIRVPLSSHTDCRGDIDYNQDLSQKRAQSAVDYIISKGIASSRIVAKGYGESNLSANCNCDDCTEDEHQKNRRTTFKVLE